VRYTTQTEVRLENNVLLLERLRGVFTTRRYINPRLPSTLPKVRLYAYDTACTNNSVRELQQSNGSIAATKREILWLKRINSISVWALLQTLLGT